METHSLLNEQKFFQIFQQIARIPHGSGNEKALSNFVVAFAAKLGLESVQDSVNNVIVRKPGSKGKESAPPVILQAHLDMVCEKNPGKVFNFATDAIELVQRDGWLWANDTTLGADNGIGVAYALAVLADDSLNHPPIEALFTVNEEVGMDGVIGLDMAMLAGRRLLNLDSEEEGELCASCAGGVRAVITLPLRKVAADAAKPAYRVAVSGLVGGHSGMDIGLGRANANVLLARTLSALTAELGADIASVEGGSANNAIPRNASAVVRVAGGADMLAQKLAELNKTFAAEAGDNDPGITLAVAPCAAAPSVVLEADCARTLLNVVLLAPNGIQYFSPTLRWATDTSCNVGVVEHTDSDAVITLLVRSNTNSRMVEVADRIRRLAEAVGGSYGEYNGYPAWEFRQDSPLRERCVDTYRALYGRDMAVSSIHAGLECALLAGKCPELDMVSFGPNIRDAHTPQERAEIASLIDVWSYLVELLARL